MCPNDCMVPKHPYASLLKSLHKLEKYKSPFTLYNIESLMMANQFIIEYNKGRQSKMTTFQSDET